MFETSETKIAAGLYRVVDKLNRAFDITSIARDENKPSVRGWNVYYVENGVSELWGSGYPTKAHARTAIETNVAMTIEVQKRENGVTDSVSPKQKKAFTATCKYCGEQYEAQRKSSRFCKPEHRVAWNRAQKRKDNEKQSVHDMLRELAHQLEDKETCHDAAITLQSIKRTVDFYMPYLSTWWHCDNCHRSMMKFIPENDDCACGKDAKWFMMNTKSG